ncbi:MAG: hypothetical protein JNL05_01845 [Flavobacteriales bacterium]|nr:hypothetical protein [Flavobacteriales bacterium]
MTPRLLLFLSFLPTAAVEASAQCCCSEVILQVSLADVPWVHSEREFRVEEGAWGTVYQVDRDSTDRRLTVWLDAGCGVADRRLTITRTTTGERMELRVLFMGFDGAHPGLRVPFVGGRYEIDLERLISCTGADVRLDRRPAVPERTELGCGTCRVVLEHDSLGVLLEPLDLCCGACASGGVEDGGNGKASYPDGQQALERAVVSAMDRPGRKGPRRPMTLDAVGCVNEHGEVYVRMEQEQTDQVYLVEMALMHVKGWSTAWVSDPASTDGRRPLRSMVRFSLDLRPSR